MIVEQMLKNAPNPLLHIADVSGSALFNADCMDVLPLIPDKSVQLILADLPYGTTNLKWDSVLDLNKLWQEYERIITDNGAIVLTASQPFTTVLINSNPTLFKYEWIWVKPQGVDPFMAKIRPLNNIEYVLVFCKGSPIYNPQYVKGEAYHIIRDKTPRVKETNGTTMKQTETMNWGQRLPIRTICFDQEKGEHPTQKPVALFEYLIATYTNEGETVLDNCIGSGTTAIAAHNTGRFFIGIEKEPKYVEIARQRVEQAQMQQSLFA